MLSIICIYSIYIFIGVQLSGDLYLPANEGNIEKGKKW